MTVKKAISHIDLLIQDKQDLKMKMIGPVLPLPIPGDTVNRFDRAMGSMLEKDIECLQSIKRQSSAGTAQDEDSLQASKERP